ncbi:hypothetical protein [Pseudonocardia sp. TRM90224]|uniref:hypothetical protein n=1 Tax=Pseudonocardia sp. TRM90224 TaxID=2812678 RepID=UPI001E547810|nr:hypothetical protein [Pseudonocardia sp. TRM90224]
MKGHLTVGFEVPQDRLEQAIAALRDAGIPTRVHQLGGTGRPILMAGFPHDGPAPTTAERDAARDEALQVLTAAGVLAVANGGGFAVGDAFARE